MILLYCLYTIVAAAAVVLPVRELWLTGAVDSGSLIRSGALLLVAVLGILRTRRAQLRRDVKNRERYAREYAAYIDSIFPEKEENVTLFYRAVDDYVRKNYAGGLKKLEKLRPRCENDRERYAVSVFSGFCLHNLEKYEPALEQYRSALAICQDSTVASNMGVCYEKLGLTDFAMRYYRIAVISNPDNPLPNNNLAQLCVAGGDYAQGMVYATHALSVKPDMLPSLTAMAVCSHMLGRQEDYEAYLQKISAAGGNPEKVKAYIQTLE